MARPSDFEVGDNLHAQPSTNIVGFRGLDSSTFFILNDGIRTPMSDFPDILHQAMMVQIIIVGGLDISRSFAG